MRTVLQFCALAAGRVVSQALGALNIPGGEAAGDKVASILAKQFHDQSQRLIDALHTADEHSWAVTESLLRKDESTWQRLCRRFLPPADERSLRAKLEGSLDTKLRERKVDPSVFRHRCLQEMDSARRAGLFGRVGIDLDLLARSLACFANPQAIVSSSEGATRQIANEFQEAGFRYLAALVSWKPDGTSSLIAFLSDYFFHRQVEQDEILYRSLTVARLEQIDKKQDLLSQKQEQSLQLIRDIHQAVMTRRDQSIAIPVAAAALPAAIAQVRTSFPFSEKELQENSEPRLPCVLLVDVSRSMAGERIAALNHGLQVYRTELMADNLASQRVEVAVAAFSSKVELICPFVAAEQFCPPQLKSGGKTVMGAALHLGIDMIEFRRAQYRRHGVGSFRPWIFLLTDGEPTDEWQQAARRIQEGETSGAFFFYVVGVEDANYDMLRQLTARPVYRLDKLRFRDLFRWLAQSQRAVSRSSPGREGTVSLLDPTRPGGWGALS